MFWAFLCACLGQVFNLPRIKVQMLWGVVVRDPYEGGGPSPARRDLCIAAILFDRDPFFGSGVYAFPPRRRPGGGGTDHGCTAPQVRVACQRLVVARSPPLPWVFGPALCGGAAMTITPLPQGNVSRTFRRAGDSSSHSSASFCDDTGAECSEAAAIKGPTMDVHWPQTG